MYELSSQGHDLFTYTFIMLWFINYTIGDFMSIGHAHDLFRVLVLTVHLYSETLQYIMCQLCLN